jgi:hypothetical protein
MSNWKIDLENKTATSENGVIFRLTRNAHGEYMGECLNPEVIPPDDFDYESLDRMIEDAGEVYDKVLRRRK